MAETNRTKRTVASGRSFGRSWISGLLLLAVLALALQSGCQEEAAAPQATSMRTEPAAPPISAEPGEPEEPAWSDPPVAQEVTSLAKPQVVDAPKITLTKTVHDFGEVGPGTAHSARFEFKNEGTAPLKITQVRSCCGVVTRGVKAGQEYAPGESGVLELDYRAGEQPAPIRRQLHILSNDPLQGIVTLTIRAQIARRIDHTPSRLKLFVRKENAGAKEIKLTSLDGQEFSIKGFRATAKAITADFDPAVKATELVLKPKADMEKLKRNLRGWVHIDLTHPECESVRLPYDVLPEFSVDLHQILMFNLKAGQPVQRELWVLSNYQDDFEIESVSSQKGTVKLLDTEKVENRYRLKLEITPPEVTGERAVMSDVLEVKIKGSETLSIQCRGFY
ncbi:MAG: DUF1573 domain-containing protein [Planctomycetota bacterium]|jgi:hypothetical protein